MTRTHDGEVQHDGEDDAQGHDGTKLVDDEEEQGRKHIRSPYGVCNQRIQQVES